MLWDALRNRGVLGLKFRRQHPFGKFVVDFYCPELKLAIEVDGPIHEIDELKGRDEIRQELIETFGVRFIRIQAEEIETNFEATIAWLESHLKTISPTLHDQEEGRGGEDPYRGTAAQQRDR